MPDDLVYALSTDERKKALFAEQAASDWKKFLLHRCRELVPGKKAVFGIILSIALSVKALCSTGDVSFVTGLSLVMIP